MTEAEWRSADDPHKLLAWLFHVGPDFNDDQFEALVMCGLLYRAELDGTQGPVSYIPVVARADGDRLPQVHLIHDIFGNPFRPTTLDPTWLTSTVVALASQIYENLEFSPMPILADALQDAGCANDDLLSHCRGPGQHVRGCWVVDLLTGRERRVPK